MKKQFSKDALQHWNGIPPQIQKKIIENVWCAKCREMTTITNFEGNLDKSDLILTGFCTRCGNKVVRLLEGEDVIVEEKVSKQVEMEKILVEFYSYLTEEKKVSEKTADRHCHCIGFFCFQYLYYCTDTKITDVDSEVIDEYLGNWYIRKVLNSHKGNIRPTLTAFKKFYQYLFDKSSISKSRLEDILSVCKQPQRYIRRFDGYESIDFESEDGEDQFQSWLYNWQDEEILIPENVNADFEPNSDLENAFLKHKLDGLAISKNFTTYINYLSDNNIKLTKTNSWLPRVHLLNLDQQMVCPEKLSSTINQDKSWRLHAFFQIALSLNLFLIDNKNTIQITPR